MNSIIKIPLGRKAKITGNYFYGFRNILKGTSTIGYHTSPDGDFYIPSHIYFEDDGTFVMKDLFVTPTGGQDDYAKYYMKGMGFWKLIKQAFRNLWKKKCR